MENNISFGIYLNTITKPNDARYLVIKPHITVQFKEQQYIDIIRKRLSLDTNVTRAKSVKQKPIHAMHIQRFDDIDRLLDFYEGYEFVSSRRQDIYDRFVAAYAHVKRIGQVWNEYDEEITIFINEHLPLQKHDKKIQYRSNTEWIRIIKKHFTA